MASDLNQTLANGSYNHVSFYNGISIEEIAGREGSDTRSSGTASRVFLLQGNTDPLVCRSALLNGPVAITLYDGLVLNSIDRTRMGPESWQFTCSYDSITPDVGGYTVSIDTTGGQILQTYGYDQTSFPATGQTATDFGFALNVQDGNPQGVQRVIPALKINVRAKIATEYLGGSPLAYAKLCARLTGFTNKDPMFPILDAQGAPTGSYEFAAGELLYIGASGDLVAENPQLTFSFLASENVSDLTIGEITGISKKGHEFLWIDFRGEKDTDTNRRVSLPRAAYVGQVYDEADLGLLKIGVAPT